MTLLVWVTIASAGSAQSPGWSPRHAFVPGGEGGVEGMTTLAADVARGRIVAFGGYVQGGANADTWEWGGSVWTPRPSATVPPPRVGAKLVVDPIRRRAVLFGGSDPGTIQLRGDTWEWDGTSWQPRLLPQSPSPRERHGIVFDAARGRILLHGGRTGVSSSGGDTWEYDGVTWTLLTPANGPASRDGHQLAYDNARQRVVMFGGYQAPQNETWEWDGTTWLAITTAVAPPPLVNHALLYDEQRQRTVLCGGYSLATSTPHRDTWEWDGSAWALRANSLPFQSGGTQVVTVADPGNGGALAFYNGTVWRWSGAAWLAQQPMSWPPRNALSASACTDTVRNRVVSMGRWTGSAPVPLTWQWDGEAWTRSPALGPTAAAGGAMAFDPLRAVSVLFGSGQTWEWDGSAWTLRNLANSPPVRSDHKLVYDAARQQIVLFGGEFYAPMQGLQPMGDTWTYDGTQWLQQNPAVVPSARSRHAMVDEPLRQRVLLFGGDNGYGSLFGDTWEWDGATWSVRTVATAPQARRGHAMVLDPQNNTVVLFGGGGTLLSQVLDDTWQWNGTTWSPVTTTRTPPARYLHAMAIDPATSQVMVHGGYGFANGASHVRDDTWLLGAPVMAGTTALGNACAAGAPPRLASPVPYLGNPDFCVELLDTAAAAPCLFGFSFATQPQQVGPCTVYLQNSVSSVFTLSNAWGVANVALPLPYVPWLRGLTFTTQAAVLAAPGAWSGLDFTAAFTIVVGD